MSGVLTTGIYSRRESYLIQYEPKMQFIPVENGNPERIEDITTILEKFTVRERVEANLKKINEKKDRKSFLICEDHITIGLLVFKTVISNKYAHYNVHDSIKIKFLIITHRPKNLGWNAGTASIDKINDETKAMIPPPRYLHLKINAKNHTSAHFFKAQGFSLCGRLEKPKQSDEVKLLFARLAGLQPRNLASGLLKEKLRDFFDNPTEYRLPRKPPELVNVIQGAHADDIHALKKLSDGTFVSGSKDNCLYKWNIHGERVKVVQEVIPTSQNERNWITALTVFNDDYWLSGERNGKVHLWTTSGEFVKELPLNFPENGNHQSHPFNSHRVNCMASSLNKTNPGILIGGPTIMSEYSWIPSRTTSITKVHQNDWTYCIHPLSEKDILAAVGGSLNMWRKEDNKWEHVTDLIVEQRPLKKHQAEKPQRPYISSVVPLRSTEDRFGISYFDGTVGVYDLTRRSSIKEWQLHYGKVWSIEPIAEHLFASSGQDKTIKIWDERVNYPVDSIEDHIGQVTSLLCLNDKLLLAGTCPENLQNTSYGGEIRYYDIRL